MIKEIYERKKSPEGYSPKDIEKYMESMENETSSQPYKPFFTLYAKKRNRLNLMRFIFGEYKFRWFEKDKQPLKYKNAFEIVSDSIDLDVKEFQIFKTSDSEFHEREV